MTVVMVVVLMIVMSLMTIMIVDNSGDDSDVVNVDS